MYDIRHFRNVLWALLLLGFTGYAVAAETPGLWVLAVSGTLLNRWLVRRDSFRPLPRLAANLITLVFAVWMVLRVRAIPGPPIFAIGEFLTFLQLVKLYEQRGNRDYAQLLILSLLLMVAAAISTASLVFGVLFVAYLFLSLYSCLLFHLKAESDHARAMLQADDLPLNPAALKQSQRYIARSMRRLTMTVSGVSLLVGLIVFLFFPRGTGAGLIGNLAFKPGDTMLVHAASGGVGSFLVQWASAAGATVIALAGSDDKVQGALENGAKFAFNSREDGWVHKVREATGGRGVDVVYDGVGKATFEQSLDCLRPRGLMVSYGNASGAVPPVDIGILAAKGSLFLTRPTLGTYTTKRADLEHVAADLFDVVAKGAVKIRVNQTFPLAEAAAAHIALEARKTTGSTVLLP